MISIVSVPIYFAVLGDEMYAILFYVGTLTGAFGFMDLGIGVAVGRFIGVAMGAGDESAAKEYWSTGSIIALPLISFFALVFVAGGLLWGPAWFKVGGENASTLRWAVLAGGVGLFFSYYGQMWFVLSASLFDFRFISLVRTTLSLVTLGGSVLVAIATKSAAWIVAFTALASAVQFSLLLNRGNRKYEFPVKISDFRLVRLSQILPYTLKTFAQLVSNSLAGSLERILLGRFATPTEFASYNVSFNVASRFQGASQAVMGPVFANSSRGVGGDANRHPRAIYGETFKMLMPFYLFITLWVVAWQKPLLTAWLGDERGALVSLSFPWVVMALSISAVTNISAAQLGSLDRMGTGLAISLVQNLLAGALTYAGWHIDGLRGAAVGLLLSRVASLIQDWIVRKHIGYKLGRDEVKLILMAAALGGISIAISATLYLLPIPAWMFLWTAAFSGLAGMLPLAAAVLAPHNPKSL